MALSTAEGLAEEQRLFYVATTRARDRLTIYSPMRLPVHPTSLHSRHVLAKPSRFLTDKVLKAMELTLSPGVQAPASAGASGGAVAPTVAVPDLGELFG